MSIWPRPVSIKTGSSVLWLSEDLSYTYQEAAKSEDEFKQLFSDLKDARDPSVSIKLGDALSSPSKKEAFLKTAFDKAKKALVGQRFVPWKMHKRGADFEPDTSGQDNLLKKVEFLECSNPSSKHRSLSPEAYRLELDGSGGCKVFVTHLLGAVAALSTLVQLFYGHSKDEKKVYCAVTPLVVQDAPFFAHRGLNLDISRNVIKPADVCRTMDGLWRCKMNKLHIHATDSQSWPLMIPSMPELAEKGAYHESQIWQPDDLEAVQLHGRHLGIEVFLEIDMPGHMGSVYHAHPDLTLAYDKLPWDRWAVEPPAGQLKLNSTAVHDFVRKLLRDLCPRVSPYTSHFHVGGDELNTNVYTLEEGIGSADKAVLRPFLQRFFDVVFAELDRPNNNNNDDDDNGGSGLTPILWEDILLDYEGLSFPPNAVFQVWRAHGSLAKILARGHSAIFGPADFWYLDVGLGGFLDPDPSNPDSPVRPPFADWNPPYKNWRLVYGYDPFDGIPDDDDESRARVRGGEVSNWGELTDAVNLDPMLWPRAAAAAEVLWSGPGNKNGEEVTRRLAELRERLVLAGIAAHVVQMEWSLRNRGRGVL